MPLWILLDENAGSIVLVGALRARGFVVATVAELGRLGRSDEDHLAFAAADRWALFTYDAGDFSQLHWAWLGMGREHNGIVVETDPLLPIGELLRRFEAPRFGGDARDTDLTAGLSSRLSRKQRREMSA